MKYVKDPKETSEENIREMSDVLKNVLKDDPKDGPKELSERQVLLIKEMKANDTITIQEMPQKIKVSEKTIKREVVYFKGWGL